jgi:hypothetical protein
MGDVTTVNYGEGPFWVTVPKLVPLLYTLKQPCPSPRFTVPGVQEITAFLIPVKSVTETIGPPGQWDTYDFTSYNDEP